MVLCETYQGRDINLPSCTNFRRECNAIMEDAKLEEPWFGIEQE